MQMLSGNPQPIHFRLHTLLRVNVAKLPTATMARSTLTSLRDVLVLCLLHLFSVSYLCGVACGQEDLKKLVPYNEGSLVSRMVEAPDDELPPYSLVINPENTSPYATHGRVMGAGTGSPGYEFPVAAQEEHVVKEYACICGGENSDGTRHGSIGDRGSSLGPSIKPLPIGTRYVSPSAPPADERYHTMSNALPADGRYSIMPSAPPADERYPIMPSAPPADERYHTMDTKTTGSSLASNTVDTSLDAMCGSIGKLGLGVPASPSASNPEATSHVT